MTENNNRRSLVVSSLHDPAAIAALAQFYENNGFPLHGSYSELIQVLVEESITAHQLAIDSVSQDSAVTLLSGLGFSVRQLESKRGLRRAARRELVEELASSRQEDSSSCRLSQQLQDKIDGIDPNPYSEDEVHELHSQGMLSNKQVEEWKNDRDEKNK